MLSSLPTLNQSSLEPIFLPWEAPDKYRRPNDLSGGAAIIESGRRVSKALLVSRLREAVEDWRRGDYAGVSPTTRTLLDHWFRAEHPEGFRYHFCQREAIETFIWLYEVAKYRDLSSIYSSLWGEDADATWEKQITAADDAWPRGVAKIATGGGKTKVMSLVMVWSFFHKRFEPDSEMATHFVAIAPNLIVFERLKLDFLAQNGAPSIFQRDPLLPPEWAGEWDVPVILQDDPGGASGAGALYLSNIHRLYERKKAAKTQENGAGDLMGPEIKRAKALSTGELLRARIASHPNFLVLNDEAHHLHDPESAWNEAIASLDADSKSRGNMGVCAQFDFSATPKYPDGSLFKHIVCDFPLGEAVDGGIVKAPVLGRSDALKPNKLDNAAQKFRAHLMLGYKQYEWSVEEWKDSGRKPILFVMTESTQAADEVTEALNSDEFPLLKGSVINLHTKLKGKVVKGEFIVNEKQMSDDDLRAVRELASSLDDPKSPYRCVVSVLMLREGWDVKSVTTIVPLRAFSGQSNILAEQTLGRGLRRMTPLGDGAVERVTVVEHSAFVKLYEQELALEGVIVQISDAEKKIKPPSVSIFVDPHKDAAALDISYPRVSDGVQTVPTVENLSFEEVRDFFRSKYAPLPIGSASSKPINFELRAMFTDEIVASWNIDRGLLRMGFTAVSVFVKELERACGLTGNFGKLAPLVQRFIAEVLFERTVNLYGGEVDHRMSNGDVAEHIRATFAPLIRERTILETKRKRGEDVLCISDWKGFQVYGMMPNATWQMGAFRIGKGFRPPTCRRANCAFPPPKRSSIWCRAIWIWNASSRSFATMRRMWRRSPKTRGRKKSPSTTKPPMVVPRFISPIFWCAARTENIIWSKPKASKTRMCRSKRAPPSRGAARLPNAGQVGSIFSSRRPFLKRAPMKTSRNWRGPACRRSNIFSKNSTPSSWNCRSKPRPRRSRKNAPPRRSKARARAIFPMKFAFM